MYLKLYLVRGFGYLTTSLGRSLLRVSTQKTENFMPLYNYECTDCGPFEEWQSMSQSAEPNTCTNCGEQSKRAMSTPGLALMSANTRTAHFRNEKSADRPEVVKKPKNVKAQEGHGKSKGGGHTHHGHSHSHSHGHGPSRPWMIGH